LKQPVKVGDAAAADQGERTGALSREPGQERRQFGGDLDQIRRRGNLQERPVDVDKQRVLPVERRWKAHRSASLSFGRM
jgi:hypothetical protein